MRIVACLGFYNCFCHQLSKYYKSIEIRLTIFSSKYL